MRINRYLSALTGFLLILISGFLTVSCGSSSAGESGTESADVSVAAAEEAATAETEAFDAMETPDEAAPVTYLPVMLLPGVEDLIIASYLDPALHGKVLAFFGEFTGSEELAAIILANAKAHGIPPALAFSLCAEESRYNPQAINRNRNDTVDRGLFQLNSESFPQLTVKEFYDPEINARYGLSHLRWCLEIGGTEVAALAIYNAGSARVRNGGTPKNTLDYISRILRRQRKIEVLFLAEYPHMLVHIEAAVKEPEKPAFRLSLLKPLGGR